jgi:hypothetical protein
MMRHMTPLPGGIFKKGSESLTRASPLGEAQTLAFCIEATRPAALARLQGEEPVSLVATGRVVWSVGLHPGGPLLDRHVV